MPSVCLCHGCHVSLFTHATAHNCVVTCVSAVCKLQTHTAHRNIGRCKRPPHEIMTGSHQPTENHGRSRALWQPPLNARAAQLAPPPRTQQNRASLTSQQRRRSGADSAQQHARRPAWHGIHMGPYRKGRAGRRSTCQPRTHRRAAVQASAGAHTQLYGLIQLYPTMALLGSHFIVGSQVTTSGLGA